MLLFLIAIFVFLSIYTLVYQFYSYRQLRLRLATVKEETSAPALKAGENFLRRLLRSLGFLTQFKAARSLANRSLPGRLVMAGSPLSIVEFIAFKILSMVIFLIIGSIIFRGSQFSFIIAAVMVGFILPDLWLNLKIKRRQVEIRRDLPAVIDLLNLCVDAGMDFMLAVSRVVKDFKKCPLTDELSEVWRETRMGASRREALQHFGRRVNLIELSSFVRTLLQADRLGSPIGEALKIQAEELRLRRYLQGEEAALKAPIKLLFPLLFFILPAVLVIVGGPILIQFMSGGVKF